MAPEKEGTDLQMIRALFVSEMCMTYRWYLYVCGIYIFSNFLVATR